MVDLVQVDVVGAEATEGALDGVEDVFAGGPAIPRLRAHGARALGGHDEIAATAPKPPPEYLLGTAHRLERTPHRIHVGGIEEGDPARRRTFQDGDRGGLIALQAEGHGAETETGDRKAGTTESDVAHGLRE